MWLDKVGALGRCGAGVVLGGGLGGQKGVAREVRGWRGRGVAGGVDVVAEPWRECGWRMVWLWLEWLEEGVVEGSWLGSREVAGGCVWSRGRGAWLEGWRVTGGIQLLKFWML